MPSLSHDIILDVLCRLGVKDLLRFRCVSKPFCSSIDDPDFAKFHLSHSLKTSNNLSLILRDCYLYSVNFGSLETAQKLNHPLDKSDKGNGTEILGSCNGLLALLNIDDEICLWNPSTRKSQMLPPTEIDFPPSAFICQFIVYGFGYDPISDDYKLVRMVQFDSFDHEVKVYSLRTNSWRKINDFPFYLKYKRGYGILANNALHWVVSEKYESDTCFVFAFDLKTEEYRSVELPDCLDNNFHMNVEVMGGCLCLIANYFEAHVVDIWMMKDYGVKESWTKLISAKQSKSFPYIEFVLPLAFSKNGDKVLLNFDNQKFYWYDMASKRAKQIRIEGVPTRTFEVEMLVESLVPLNDNAAMINKEKKQHSKKKQKKQRKNTKRDAFLFEGFHLVL